MCSPKPEKLFRRKRGRADVPGDLTCAHALAFALIAGAGCDQPPPDPLPDIQPTITNPVPVPGKHLYRSSPTNDGLLQGLGPDGWPVREGPSMDPLIVESRRFYDTIQHPDAQPQPVDYPNPFTGMPEPARRTAPLTFEAWKTAFGFPVRTAGETLEAYRQRAGVVIYYNKNELGLGRELGCAEFVDGTGPGGERLLGLACYVINYGAAFRDRAHSLATAVAGGPPRNTVCITYRPTMEPGYQVQFYAYGPDGKRQEWAQLDTLGPRPHPHVCMNCHGGVYDEKKHLAKWARFLPLDPNVVEFAHETDGPASATRAAQEERIRVINAVSLRTPLSPAQHEMVQALYGGTPTVAGTPSRGSWVLSGWRGVRAEEEFFDRVIKPYCATCHLAIYQGLGDTEVLSYGLFASPAHMRQFPLQAVVCGAFTMPNAQPTMINFWDTSAGPVMVGGSSYPSAADAMLARYDLDRSRCPQLGELTTCARGPDPDNLCGNATSGAACNRMTGRCVPDPGTARAAGKEHGQAVCRLDRSRRCPGALTCRPAAPPPGLDRFDGVCR